MDVTLNIDDQVLKNAERIASMRHTTLSELVEQYLNRLTSCTEGFGNSTLTPLVEKLSGAIPDFVRDKDSDEYAAYLDKKYK